MANSVWDGDGAGLACPSCGSESLRVVGTRAHRGTVRRQRKCKTCEFEFLTMEAYCDIECRLANYANDAALPRRRSKYQHQKVTPGGISTGDHPPTPGSPTRS